PASSHVRECRGDEPERATSRLGPVGLAEAREVVDFYPREGVAPTQQAERLVELKASRQAGHLVDVVRASALPRCADDEEQRGGGEVDSRRAAGAKLVEGEKRPHERPDRPDRKRLA